MAGSIGARMRDQPELDSLVKFSLRFLFWDAPRDTGFDFKGKFKLSTTYMYHLDLIHYIRFHIPVV